MMDDRDFYWLSAAIAGLAVCSLLQSAIIRRLRADVDFLTVVSEKAMRDGRV
jgi:hypothetical protein